MVRTDRAKLGRIRQSLLKVGDYDLRTIFSRLKRPEICSPETYQELIRTPRIQGRLIGLGLMQKPLSEREEPLPNEDPSSTTDIPSLSVEELGAQIANGRGVQIVDARQRDHMSRHVDLMAARRGAIRIVSRSGSPI